MQSTKIKNIIKEEVHKLLEASITKGFRKAVEALQKAQLAQQTLRKAFVAEKDPKQKEKLKQSLIKMHKVVQKVEVEFNDVLRNEPAGELEELDVRKVHGDEKIDNPDTGNTIKLSTALKSKKSSAVYRTAKAKYNQYKDKE
jgi:hypothetical protein|tara:strand:+ start:6511 stop:6936 length:426 start_codon:yes stop_codon:yes gene_type:complete